MKNKSFFLAAVMESICSLCAVAAEIGGISSFPHYSSLPVQKFIMSIDPGGTGSQGKGKNTTGPYKIFGVRHHGKDEVLMCCSDPGSITIA